MELVASKNGIGDGVRLSSAWCEHTFGTARVDRDGTFDVDCEEFGETNR